MFGHRARKKAGRCAGSSGKLGCQHLRGQRPHGFAFMGAVIKKDKTVEPDIDLLRQLANILRLWGPVDAMGNEIIFVQNNAGMVGKRRDGGGIVFAQDCEDHALALEAQKLVLHGFKGIAGEIIATLQAGDAIFAKNAAPHGVIEINGQHLGRTAFFGAPRQRKGAGQRA